MVLKTSKKKSCNLSNESRYVLCQVCRYVAYFPAAQLSQLDHDTCGDLLSPWKVEPQKQVWTASVAATFNWSYDTTGISGDFQGKIWDPHDFVWKRDLPATSRGSSTSKVYELWTDEMIYPYSQWITMRHILTG